MTPAAPDRVLIIKPSSLGDVVSAMPMLRALRRALPQAHIAWLVSPACAPLLRHDPDLSEIIDFDRKRLTGLWRSPSAIGELLRLQRRLRAGRFDWVLDAQGLFRSGWLARATRAPVRAGFADAREGAWLFYTHRIATHDRHTVRRNVELLRALGIHADESDMTLTVDPAAAAEAHALLRAGGVVAPYLVAVPPTRWPTKLYPAAHWRAVLAEVSRDLPVVLAGSPDEKPIVDLTAAGADPARVVNLCGRTGVAQFVAMVASSRGVICSDSAAMFIAPAVGAPCVALIGPTRVERTGPLWGEAVVSGVACQGCLRRRCSHVSCMGAIAPSRVVAAVRRMLQSNSTPCGEVWL
jgi:heptosyltransferase-1/heptosyltransferase-2